MKLPKLNVPEKDKNPEWVRDVIFHILKSYNAHDHFNDQRRKDIDNYLIVDGHLDPKHYQYVTNMYGLTSPARYVNYPMILPKLNTLAGELMSQPLQFTTHVVNRSALRRKNEKKVTAAAEVLLRPIRREFEKALGTKIEDEEIGMEIPEHIEEFKNMKFRDHVEEFVNIGLQDLIKKHRLKHTFKRGFMDLGIVYKEFYHVYIKNKHPYAERIDPRIMIYDYDADSEDTDKGKFIGKDTYYTVNEIISMYPDLDKKTVDKLEELEGRDTDWFNAQNQSGLWYQHERESGLKVRTVHMQFRALRLVKYKVSENKFDPETPFYKLVKDTYKAKDGENIVEKYIDDIWEGVLFGHEIIHNARRLPNQIRYEENYAEANFSFIGSVPNRFSGSATSIVDALKNINIHYNITMFHIQLAMQRAGGKAVVYDTAQKPKKMEITEVLHHAKNSGLIFINSQQEGYQTNSFNQFSQVDFSVSQSITSLFNYLMLLDDLADRITGISAARSGINKSGDLVGVNERNIMQSSLITLPMVETHYNTVGKVLNRMAGLMKIAYAGEERMANLFGDNYMQFFKMDKSISLDEVNVYIENNGKEIQDKQNMHMLLQQAVSSGQGDLKMLAKALRADSASEIERIIDSGVTAIDQVIQMNKERDQQLQEQSNAIAEKKINVDIEVANIKAQSDITVAQIQAKNKADINERNLEHEGDKITADQEHSMDMEMLSSANRETEKNTNQ